MNQIFKLTLVAACLVSLFSCSNPKASSKGIIEDNIEFASQQIGREIDMMNAKGVVLNPRTIREDGSTRYNTPELWTSGFFPGSLWYMYELTAITNGKSKLRKLQKHWIQFNT